MSGYQFFVHNKKMVLPTCSLDEEKGSKPCPKEKACYRVRGVPTRMGGIVFRCSEMPHVPVFGTKVYYLHAFSFFTKIREYIVLNLATKTLFQNNFIDKGCIISIFTYKYAYK